MRCWKSYYSYSVDFSEHDRGATRADRTAGVPRGGDRARVAAPGERGLHISQPALSEAVTKLEQRARRHPARPPPDRRADQPPGPRPAAEHDRGARGRRPAAQAAGQQSVRRRDLRSAPSTPPSSTLLVPALRDLHAPARVRRRRGGQRPAGRDLAGARRGLPRPGPGQRAARRRDPDLDRRRRARSHGTPGGRAARPTTRWPRRSGSASTTCAPSRTSRCGRAS